MSALIETLDNFTPTQQGENGHKEYGWSNSLQEQILQFYFQLTRTDADGVIILKSILSGILFQLKYKLAADPTNEDALNYLIQLYKIIGQTRDIIDGKGECVLTYMMIHTWYEYYTELAFHALKCLVNNGEQGGHPYGSWKDIKYFCHYCLEQGPYMTVEHPLIQVAIGIINNQLRIDASTPPSQSISLAAKWVPREKSKKFGGKLYAALAGHYFVRYIMSSNNADENKRKESQAAAITKSKANYRKLIAGLNHRIDTLQIKQCGKRWAEIDFNKVTSVSLLKQKRAFLNVTKKGEPRYEDEEDRVTCASHFEEHIQKAVRGEIEVKGKRVGLNDFTREALYLLRENQDTTTEVELLNSQWRDNSTQNNELGNFIPMVDVSGSMTGEPLHAAIALGIRIAEKSRLGKRVMTFSNTPEWVNLNAADGFVSMVDVLQSSDWGMSTNFEAAMDLILDAIVSAQITAEEVQDMVLVILSDMQMNESDVKIKTGKEDCLFEEIKQKYADAGMKSFGKPFKAPHILFWNLNSTSGFPSLSNERNASMVSGFSPVILNSFCEKGLAFLQATTPWAQLESSLSNSRYSILELKAREWLTTPFSTPVDYKELGHFLNPDFLSPSVVHPIF